MKLSVSDIIHSYLYLYCQVKTRKPELIRVVIGHIHTLTVRKSVSLSSKRETSSQGKKHLLHTVRHQFWKEEVEEVFSYFLSLKSYLFSS